MAKKVEKNLSTLVQEAKTFHEMLDVLIVDLKRAISSYQRLLKNSPQNKQSTLESIKSAEARLGSGAISLATVLQLSITAMNWGRP